MNGRLNLGMNNTTFPLISLMNGLTRMVTGVLTGDSVKTTGEDSEELMDIN